MLAMPVIALAQQEKLPVKMQGSKITVMDFARAYCSTFESKRFERNALAAFTQGSFKKGTTQCIADTKNGYLKYAAKQDGTLETLEMCYWRCDNKNEMLVAINRITDAMGMDESFLTFYRYNAKTKSMRLIEPPFDRMPQPIDMVDHSTASDQEIEMVSTAGNEDSNKYQPCYKLPHTGKDITFRMADPTAIGRNSQRQGSLHWNGNGFNIE